MIENNAFVGITSEFLEPTEAVVPPTPLPVGKLAVAITSLETVEYKRNWLKAL